MKLISMSIHRRASYSYKILVSNLILTFSSSFISKLNCFFSVNSWARATPMNARTEQSAMTCGTRTTRPSLPFAAARQKPFSSSPLSLFKVFFFQQRKFEDIIYPIFNTIFEMMKRSHFWKLQFQAIGASKSRFPTQWTCSWFPAMKTIRTKTGPSSNISSICKWNET